MAQKESQQRTQAYRIQEHITAKLAKIVSLTSQKDFKTTK